MNTTTTTVRGTSTKPLPIRKKPTPTPGARSTRVNYGPGGILTALAGTDLSETPVLRELLHARGQVRGEGEQ